MASRKSRSKADKPDTAADTAREVGARTGTGNKPLTTMILADVALRSGGALLKRAVEQGILGQQVGKANAKKIVKRRSLRETLVATAVARIATRSVPGAIIIGGGMLAKTLYDRRRKPKPPQD